MSRIYVKTGERIQLRNGVVRIGTSGTIVDSTVDWTESHIVTQMYEDDESSVDLSGDLLIGEIGIPINGDVTGDLGYMSYDVYLEAHSGKLFYNVKD